MVNSAAKNKASLAWLIVRSNLGYALAVMVLATASLYVGHRLFHAFVPEGDTSVFRGNVPAPKTFPIALTDGRASSLTLVGREKPLLLYVLSVDCGFCARNLPGWVELKQDAAETNREPLVDIVVLSVSSAGETLPYLMAADLDVSSYQVRAHDLGRLGATGFPTTIAYTPENPAVIGVWTGVLSARDREEILAVLKEGRAADASKGGG